MLTDLLPMADLPLPDPLTFRSTPSWATCSRRCEKHKRAADLRRPERARDHEGRAGACSEKVGATDRCCCSSRAVSPLARPRSSWPASLARSRARRSATRPGSTARSGKRTRVIAMTHGVFLSRIQADPELAGVSAVLFDEVHERSLDNDLALALALDAASALRDDLRLVAMSATLDVERFQRLLDNPPTIVSEGKSFPLEIRYAGRDATAQDRAANGFRDPRRAWRA